MAKCLFCDGDINEGRDFFQTLICEDQLCGKCRQQLIESKYKERINNIKVLSLYEYNEFFSNLIIQYKECYDEAIADIFLSKHVSRLKRRFKGHTLLLMPSSIAKEEERGFNHLELMFKCLNLEMLDCFQKTSEIDQKRLNGEMRQKMSHGIVLKKGIKLPPKIVLVDDILTTGNTIKGALNCIDVSRHKILIFTVATPQKSHQNNIGE